MREKNIHLYCYLLCVCMMLRTWCPLVMTAPLPHPWLTASPYVIINIHTSQHVIRPLMAADVMEPILAQWGLYLTTKAIDCDGTREMSIVLLFVIFTVAWRCCIDARFLCRPPLCASRATVGSWLSLLTLSCLTPPNKQSSQLIACQVLFETISTHAPLKHARPMKRHGETNRAVQLSSQTKWSTSGAALGAP